MLDLTRGHFVEQFGLRGKVTKQKFPYAAMVTDLVTNFVPSKQIRTVIKSALNKFQPVDRKASKEITARSLYSAISLLCTAFFV